MRVNGWLVALVVSSSSVAQAADHRMKVGEVLLSTESTAGAQYLELWNTAPGGESFPSTTYQVTIYDTDKGVVGTVVIGDMPTTNRWLLSNALLDSELGTEADTVLDVTLPTVGAACFERDAGEPIHCLTWGCPNDPPTAPSTSEGDTPLAGEALAVDESTPSGGNDDLYEITTATPGEANPVVGTTSTACPAVIPDAGPSGTPDAGGTGASPDSGSGGGGDGDGGCAAGGGTGDGAPLALSLLVALVLVRRRLR